MGCHGDGIDKFARRIFYVLFESAFGVGYQNVTLHSANNDSSTVVPSVACVVRWNLVLWVNIKLVKLICYLSIVYQLVVTVAVGSGGTKVEGWVQVLNCKHPLATRQSTFVVVETNFTQYFKFVPAPKQYAPVRISAKSEKIALFIFGVKTYAKELLGSVVNLLILVRNYFF